MTNYSQRSKSGKSSFKRDEGRDYGRNNEIHTTKCADCGKSCQVPFKPNGKKPVYCNDCFAKNGGQGTPRTYSAKPERSSYSPTSQPHNDSKKFDQMSTQLKALNEKFDKVIALLEQQISK